MNEKTITYTEYNEREIEDIVDRQYAMIRDSCTTLKILGWLSDEDLQEIAKLIQGKVYGLKEEPKNKK